MANDAWLDAHTALVLIPPEEVTVEVGVSRVNGLVHRPL